MQREDPAEQLSVLVLTRIVNVSALDLENVRINAADKAGPCTRTENI